MGHADNALGPGLAPQSAVCGCLTWCGPPPVSFSLCSLCSFFRCCQIAKLQIAKLQSCSSAIAIIVLCYCSVLLLCDIAVLATVHYGDCALSAARGGASVLIHRIVLSQSVYFSIGKTVLVQNCISAKLQ